MSGLHVKMAGQTINDRLLAARHSIAGQGLAKSVCKATTEEMIAPKKKHLDCKYCFNIILIQIGYTVSEQAYAPRSIISLAFDICDLHLWSILQLPSYECARVVHDEDRFQIYLLLSRQASQLMAKEIFSNGVIFGLETIYVNIFVPHNIENSI